MSSTANAPTKTQDQKQSGCCCTPPSGATKITSAEIDKTASKVEQDPRVKKVAGDRSNGCCGGH